MVEVARLVGMELRSYEKDGQKKQYCGLQLVYVEDSVSEVIGSKVEAVSCPRGVNPDNLVIGSLYQLDYELFTIKGEKRARLSDLLLVEEGEATEAAKAAGKKSQ